VEEEIANLRGLAKKLADDNVDLKRQLTEKNEKIEELQAECKVAQSGRLAAERERDEARKSIAFWMLQIGDCKWRYRFAIGAFLFCFLLVCWVSLEYSRNKNERIRLFFENHELRNNPQCGSIQEKLASLSLAHTDLDARHAEQVRLVATLEQTNAQLLVKHSEEVAAMQQTNAQLVADHAEHVAALEQNITHQRAMTAELREENRRLKSQIVQWESAHKNLYAEQSAMSKKHSELQQRLEELVASNTGTCKVMETIQESRETICKFDNDQTSSAVLDLSKSMTQMGDRVVQLNLN